MMRHLWLLTANLFVGHAGSVNTTQAYNVYTRYSRIIPDMPAVLISQQLQPASVTGAHILVDT